MNQLILIALALSQSTPDRVYFPPKGSPEQRANFERGQARQFRFEQSYFNKAGFEPLENVLAEGRAVKRVLFFDAYGLFSIPGIEVERLKDETVLLRVVSRSGASTQAALRTADWEHLTKLQGALFRPRPYIAWDPRDDPPIRISQPPPPICHGWRARFGIADEIGLGSGSWAQCGSGRNGPEFRFMSEMARLAVATQRQCRFDQADPIASFSGCFRRK